MVTLDKCVNNFINSINGSDSDYARAYWFGVRGFEELEYDVTGMPVSRTLCISANNTAELPEGCMSIIDLGFLNSIGELVSLRENGKVSLVNDECCERLDQTTNNTSDQSIIGNNSNVGPYFTSYGVGSHNDVGSYRIDWKNRLIVFDFRQMPINGEVVIEYMSSLSDCDEILIHEYAQSAVEAYIEWKWIENNRNWPTVEKERKHRRWALEKSKAKNRLKSGDYYQFLIEFRRQIRSSAKI